MPAIDMASGACKILSPSKTKKVKQNRNFLKSELSKPWVSKKGPVNKQISILGGLGQIGSNRNTGESMEFGGG